MTAPSPIRGLRASFVFLTRVPVGGFPYRERDWAWAAAHAPFVGLAVGACLGGLDRLLLPLGNLPAAVLVMGASLLITGAFHEDGLADTSDALGGGRDAAQVLTILKDSRVGAFGAAALVVSLAARSALLAELGRAGLWALPLVGCLARVGPVWLMSQLRYVTSASSAKSSHLVGVGPPQVLCATAWFASAAVVVAALGYATPARLAAVSVAAAGVTAITGWRYARRIGGFTGDFLGATEQLAEIATLAVLAFKV